jgi:hypothetical protein
MVLAIGGDSGGDGGSDFIVLVLPRTGRAVSTACIRPSGLSEGDGSIARLAIRSRIATVTDAIAAGSPSRSRVLGRGWLLFYLQQERSNLYI